MSTRETIEAIDEETVAMQADAMPAPVAAGDEKAAPIEEPPPFLGSWKNVYLFVLGELAFLVILFHVLTRWVS